MHGISNMACFSNVSGISLPNL